MDPEKIFAGDNCPCVYCCQYARDHDSIMSLNPRWLTISPPADTDEPLASLGYWLKKFRCLNDISRDFILVAEVSDQLRLHFHILYSLKDHVKEYKYINGWRHEAQIRVYNGGPKAGKHYLFKDINTTSAYLPNTLIIHTRESLAIYHENLKDEKRKVKQQEKTYRERLDEGIYRYLLC